MEETEIAQRSLFDRLESVLDGQNATATFACGGSLASKLVESSGPGIPPPNPILFYEDHTSQSHKIVFPASTDDIERLGSNCDPATFGVGGESRFDVEYRSAWKLDNTKFATSFHPSDSDIMEIIKQLLFSGAIHLDPFQPIIIAELYKLNIYKGPYDRFKAHVDTPRAQNQFGSLVACLPCAHTGGELVVRHADRAVSFKWGGESKEIQWAAFYSDCEHEVLPVTSGYRVTLTYNLYYNKCGSQIPAQVNWKGSTLPLYEVFSEVLRSKCFMPHGGVLGVYCHHSYAHSSDSPNERLPAMMKGADAAFLVVCDTLGLKTQARPVYDVDEHWEDYYDSDNPESQWYKGKIQYLDPLSLFGQMSESNDHLAEGDDKWVGDRFRKFRADHWGDIDKWVLSAMRDTDGYNNIKGIHWLNNPKFQEGEYAMPTYGNEPSIYMLYSAAAMFVLIPKWDEKRGLDCPEVSSDTQRPRTEIEAATNA